MLKEIKKELKNFFILILCSTFVITLFNPVSVHAANEDLPKFTNTVSDVRYKIITYITGSLEIQGNVGLDYSDCGHNHGYDISDISKVTIKDYNNIFNNCVITPTSEVNYYSSINGYNGSGIVSFDSSLNVKEGGEYSNITEENIDEVSKKCSLSIIVEFSDGSTIENPLVINGTAVDSSSNTIVTVYNYSEDLNDNAVENSSAVKYIDKDSNTLYLDKDNLSSLNVSKGLPVKQVRVKDSDGNDTVLYNNDGVKFLDDYRYDASSSTDWSVRKLADGDCYAPVSSLEDAVLNYPSCSRNSLKYHGVSGILVPNSNYGVSEGYKFTYKPEFYFKNCSRDISNIYSPKIPRSFSYAYSISDLQNFLNSSYTDNAESVCKSLKARANVFQISYISIDDEDEVVDEICNKVEDFIKTLPSSDYTINDPGDKYSFDMSYRRYGNPASLYIKFSLDRDSLKKFCDLFGSYSNLKCDFSVGSAEISSLPGNKILESSNPDKLNSYVTEILLVPKNDINDLISDDNISKIQEIINKAKPNKLCLYYISSNGKEHNDNYDNLDKLKDRINKNPYNEDFTKISLKFTTPCSDISVYNSTDLYSVSCNLSISSDVVFKTIDDAKAAIKSGDLTINYSQELENYYKDFNCSYEPQSSKYATIKNSSVVFKPSINDVFKVGNTYTLYLQNSYFYTHSSEKYHTESYVKSNDPNCRVSNIVIYDDVADKIKSSFNKFNDLGDGNYVIDPYRCGFISINQYIDYEYAKLKIASKPSEPRDLKASVDKNNKVNISWSSPLNEGLGSSQDGKAIVDNVVHVDKYKVSLYKQTEEISNNVATSTPKLKARTFNKNFKNSPSEDLSGYTLVKTEEVDKNSSLNDVDLEPDTTYKVVVSGSNIIGDGDNSTSVFNTNPVIKPDTEPDPTPEDKLSKPSIYNTSTTTSSITMEWDYSGDVEPEGYKVAIQEEGSTNELQWIDVSKDTLTYDFTDLKPETYYNVYVKAYKGSEESDYDSKSVCTDVIREDTTLDKPSIVNVSSTTDSVSYNWKYEGGVQPDGYEIACMKSDDFDDGIDINWVKVDAQTLSNTVSNLEDNTKYRVFVRAYKDNKTSDYDSALVTTQKIEKPEPKPEPKPETSAKPEIVNTYTTLTTFYFEWTYDDSDCTKKATGFQVGICDSKDGVPTNWIDVSINDRSHEFSGLNSDKTYYVFVRAMYNSEPGGNVSDNDKTKNKQPIKTPEDKPEEKQDATPVATETVVTTSTPNKEQYIDNKISNEKPSGIVKTYDKGMFSIILILSSSLVIICIVSSKKREQK